MINLLVVIASVRPGRVGEPVANWFVPIAEADERFNVEVADLKAQLVCTLEASCSRRATISEVFPIWSNK